MPTVAEYNDQIAREVPDPNGTLAPLLASPYVLWTGYATQGLISPDLQALYTKRAALDIRVAEEQRQVDYTRGQELQASASQRFAHLQQMRDDVQAEIVRIEQRLAAGRVPKAGVITKVEPVSPPYGIGPDANSDLYSGSPYRRLRRPF